MLCITQIFLFGYVFHTNLLSSFSMVLQFISNQSLLFICYPLFYSKKMFLKIYLKKSKHYPSCKFGVLLRSKYHISYMLWSIKHWVQLHIRHVIKLRLPPEWGFLLLFKKSLLRDKWLLIVSCTTTMSHYGSNNFYICILWSGKWHLIIPT